MRRHLKQAALAGLAKSGVSTLVRASHWRGQRLLILCYHGIAQYDEHLWRPGLFMPPSLLDERLAILKRDAYNVLPLGAAIQQLRSGELPARSVAITFDDGGYDFYTQAYPLLRKYGFPVTVYQTSYYSVLQRPIFNLICSYMLWIKRGLVLNQGKEIGFEAPLDLRTEESRQQIIFKLVKRSEQEDLTGQEKDALASRLAAILDIDYDELVRKRIVQLMNSSEVAEMAAQGVDFQLHTHRHRTPKNESLFRKELDDNRKWLEAAVGRPTEHFCYPAGDYDPQFLPWLRAERVISATTCDTGLATPGSDSLLLPRFVDTTTKTTAEFESWLTGVGDLLSFRREAARHRLQLDGYPDRH
jgi:peptidoglycan/xylan/chitin deacetylase (PgdA/CDA1 family)